MLLLLLLLLFLLLLLPRQREREREELCAPLCEKEGCQHARTRTGARGRARDDVRRVDLSLLGALADGA